MSSVDNLKKEAKRWLKALRDNDRDARARLTRAYPAAPADPVLRDVQHALAREHGHESWEALKAAIAADAAARDARRHSLPDVVARFLTFACWDHHTHGKGDHRMHDRAAQRFLAQYPGHRRATASTPRSSAGEIDEVRADSRRTAGRGEGAGRLTRLDADPLSPLTRASPIRRRSTTAWTSRGCCSITARTRRTSTWPAIRSTPRWSAPPARESRTRRASRMPRRCIELLLERGAEPYDIQVLYDTHFSGDMIWWLEPTYRHTLKLGRKADWDDPAWSMLDMGGYGPGAYFILKTAVDEE